MESVQLLSNKIRKLEQQLSLARSVMKKNKYGIVWHNVPEAFESEAENRIPVLREEPSKCIENSEAPKNSNLIIEGDNFHALTCLNYTHKEKVDVIYIDPPYNTGSDGFKYRDKRYFTKYPDGTEVPPEHPLRHSYWLSFMSKRLELAKSLLSENGVLFISIDDNESAQLKLLCDQVFSEKNYVGCIVWERKRKGSHLSKKFTKKTEYIHIYGRSGKDTELFGESVSEEDDFPLIKRTNSIKELTIPAKLTITKLSDGLYLKGEYGEGSSSVELLEDIWVKDGQFTSDIKLRGPFVWTQQNLNLEASKGAQFFIKTIKFNLRAKKGDLSNSFKALSSFFSRTVGTNEDAKTELSRILGVAEDKLPIDYPKPMSLVKKLIASRSFLGKPLTILDFFAGSGTTGHATLELVRETGVPHSFILVTNNESNIMDNACYPRITNVISGYEFHGKIEERVFEQALGTRPIKKISKLGEHIDEMIDAYKKKYPKASITESLDENKVEIVGTRDSHGRIEGIPANVRFYTTQFIGENNAFDASDDDRLELSSHCGHMLAMAERTLDLKVSKSCYQIFEGADKYTSVYFEEDLSELDEFVEVVNALAKPVSVFIFSWGSNSEHEKLFEKRGDVEVKAIPHSILEVYTAIRSVGALT